MAGPGVSVVGRPPSGRSEQRALREGMSPPSPSRARQPAALVPWRSGRRLCLAPVPAQTAGAPGEQLRPCGRAPAGNSNLKSWSSQGERARPHLLAARLPFRLYRDPAWSKAGTRGSGLAEVREPPRLRRRRRAAGPAGAGRRLGGLAPSRCGPRAGLWSPGTKNNPRQGWRRVPLRRSRASVVE